MLFLWPKLPFEVGAPQIRNRATVAGNLITASPANDTITPLMALGATVTLDLAAWKPPDCASRFLPRRAENGHGARRDADGDLVSGNDARDQRGMFLKLALRSAQAISVVNVAVVLDLQGEEVRRAAIALGAVAPTIIRAEAAERFLEGKPLDAASVDRAALLTRDASRPIDDIRGSAAYRKEMVRVLTRRALLALRDGAERRSFPADPVFLRGAIGWRFGFPAGCFATRAALASQPTTTRASPSKPSSTENPTGFARTRQVPSSPPA